MVPTAVRRRSKGECTMMEPRTLLRILGLSAFLGLASLALALPANARVNVSLGIGVPVYPAPVVVAPAPVVVAPLPAVVYPAPIVVGTGYYGYYGYRHGYWHQGYHHGYWGSYPHHRWHRGHRWSWLQVFWRAEASLMRPGGGQALHT